MSWTTNRDTHACLTAWRSNGQQPNLEDMKSRFSKRVRVLCALCLVSSGVLGGISARAAGPVITFLGRNGVLISTNLFPGSKAAVEWAPSATGPWTNKWSGLDSVTADSNGVIRVSVPMFYRVSGFPFVPHGFAWIPPGTFTMGIPTTEALRSADEVQHLVTMSKGFYIGKHPVTQADYLAVVGRNPSYFNINNGYALDLTRPVEQVSWFDATNYCGSRTAQERAVGLIPTNYVYRLPTESEWEYACRAGTTTAFYLGNALHSGQANFNGHYEYDAMVGLVKNLNGISLQRTTSVGSYAPNAWGLHDMIGNVWEWCQDWYGSYPTGSVTDSQGPATGSSRVVRGGHWYSEGRYCRSAQRHDNSPSVPSNILGFRVVLAPVQ